MQIEGQQLPIVSIGNQIKLIDDQQAQFQHKTLNHNSLYYTFTQRYFTNFQNHYQYLHLHSNGICLIAVKPSGLPSQPKQIKDFIQVCQVKGKKKKGGIKVRPQTVIAKILCSNGQQVKILALIQGTILQKNQNISIKSLGKPQGFFIIILPQKKIIPQKFGMTKISVALE